MKKLIALFALLIMAALSLTACGDDDSSSGSRSGASSAHFNNADVTFAQSMIPHHQQAVQMAEMAKTHASSDEVKQLAADIEAAQAPEIETMQAWLEDWGKDGGSTDSGGPDDHGMDDMGGGHMDSGDMPGMMNDDDLRGLAGAHGGSWDRMFLTMMIEHHEGAIDMARTEQAHGKNADAIALAKRIESAQQAEIAKMRGMLSS